MVSSVTTIASQPHASARRTKLATSSSDVLQYSWNQRGASPIAAAHSSIGTDAWVEKIIGTPVGRRGARDGEVGVAVRQLEHADRREQQRRRQAAAEQLDASVARGDVARASAGRSGAASNAARLARIVPSARRRRRRTRRPRGVIAACARASSSRNEVGTAGRLPRAPAR